MNSNFKKVRFFILCLLMLLVGGTTVFVGNLGYAVDQTQGQLHQMEEVAEKSRQDFITLSVMTQQIFLQTIEESWRVNIASNRFASREETLSNFEQSLNVLLSQAWDSMIVAIKQDNQIIYQGYIREEYEEYFQTIDWDQIPVSDLYVIEDLNLLSDQYEEKLYISGTSLEHNNIELDVYVFFEEQIMLDTMVESFSIELLQETRGSLTSILNFVALFLVFVIGLSFLIVFFLRKLYIDTKSTCPYYGNALCHATKVLEAKKQPQRGTGGY